MLEATVEIALTDSSKEHRIPAQLKKAQRREDRSKPLMDYEVEAAAIRAKTERLKALRMARDAAATPAAAGSSRTKKPTRTKGKTNGTLAEWLSDRQKDGHH